MDSILKEACITLCMAKIICLHESLMIEDTLVEISEL